MVYIQGGGFSVDGLPNVNGIDVLLQPGLSIVFAQIKYRVGLWGFLANEEIRANGILNAGLLHQRKELQRAQDTSSGKLGHTNLWLRG